MSYAPDTKLKELSVSEAIDLILAGIDPTLTGVAEMDRSKVSMLETWPMKLRNEAQRYWPSGQRFLALYGGRLLSAEPSDNLLPPARC